MGRYVTTSDFLVRYPIGQSWHEGSHTMVESHLIYFSEYAIDAALAAGFPTPFSVAYPTVKDLVFEDCLIRVIKDKDPEKAKMMQDALWERIQRIIDGEESIMTPTGPLSPSGPGVEIWSNTMEYHPTHSMLDPGDSPYTRVSSELQYAQENERG
jgi:hypothetical protein